MGKDSIIRRRQTINNMCKLRHSSPRLLFVSEIVMAVITSQVAKFTRSLGDNCLVVDCHLNANQFVIYQDVNNILTKLFIFYNIRKQI